MPLVSCPDCNHTISDAAPHCVSCGRPMGGAVATASTPSLGAYTPPRARSEFDCPKCGSSSTRKLSLVHEGGSSTIATGTVGVGYAFGGGAAVGGAKTRGVQVTALAERVAPPAMRNPAPWAFAVIFGLVLLTVHWFPAIVVGGMGMFGFWKVREYNTGEFLQLMDTWRRSSLCDRCGEVFVL